MGLMAKNKGGQDFDPVPSGMHLATCYSVVDLGTRFYEKWGKTIHKCNITWELPNERIDIEKEGETLNLPQAISKRYTLSLHEKAILRKDLETWRGRPFTGEELEGFDLKHLLGVPCNLQVQHTKKDDKTYANITSIIPLMTGQEKPAQENPSAFFSFDDATDPPENVPEWLVNIIKESDEYKASHGGQPEENQFLDEQPPDYGSDVPF